MYVDGGLQLLFSASPLLSLFWQSPSKMAKDVILALCVIFVDIVGNENDDACIEWTWWLCRAVNALANVHAYTVISLAKRRHCRMKMKPFALGLGRPPCTHARAR